MIKDYDLISIQEIRELLLLADSAFQHLREYTQNQVDHIVEAMSQAAEKNARQLAVLAVEETGIGKIEDKFLKNMFAAKQVYESIKNMKTVGVIREDPLKQIQEVAMPVGIICGIIPTTNPISTTVFKSLIAVKSRNPIVFSPHPSAKKCILATAEILHEAAMMAGAPRGVIGCPSQPSIQGTKEMMCHKLTAMILATGGSDMVLSAYSSGKPALGVGPGNVPVYIHESADLSAAVRMIIHSKTFDNGTICSSEQAIVADRAISKPLIKLLQNSGCHFLSDEESERLARVLMTPKGTISPKLVGRSPQIIALEASIRIPENTRVIIAPQKGIGTDFPLSREKLTPVLAFYEVDGPDEGCRMSIELLKLGGLGHSMVIHAMDEKVIQEFALKKPVSRLLVNTSSSQGAIGLTTGLVPSLTLGCGSFGGNATSDNITATHLINIKRVARHLHDFSLNERNATPEKYPVDQIRKLVRETLDQILPANHS